MFRRSGSRRWAGPVAVAVAVAGVGLAGILLRMPATSGRPAVAAADSPTAVAGAQSSPSFPHPSVSQAYVTVSPGTGVADPTASRDAPLPLTGACPGSVDLTRLPNVNPFDATTWPRQVTAVTLCRYAQSTFDTSEGHNVLVRGPVDGDLAVFSAALAKALPPVRPIDHLGCRITNPGPPYTVDIVFITAAGDSGRAYIMLRTVCDPPWPEDPEQPLRDAVDAILGPPY